MTGLQLPKFVLGCQTYHELRKEALEFDPERDHAILERPVEIRMFGGQLFVQTPA